jgi:hypothetical protein
MTRVPAPPPPPPGGIVDPTNQIGTTTTICPTVTPVDTTKTPCAQAKAMATDANFKAEMADLKTKTGLPNEVGYTIDANGNYTYVQGIAGAASIDLAPTTLLSGYIHTHYTGTFPTFSGSDIKAIYQLQQVGKISNISKFTAGVVTASGTTYILKINDPTKFAAFAASNLNTDANFKSFENFYANNQTVNQTLRGMDLVSSYEAALLTALKDSGITLLKGDINGFSSWSTEKINTNNVIAITNCN